MNEFGRVIGLSKIFLGEASDGTLQGLTPALRRTVV
jgi:hypothetical protein